jgi:hypothetical protein
MNDNKPNVETALNPRESTSGRGDNVLLAASSVIMTVACCRTRHREMKRSNYDVEITSIQPFGIGLCTRPGNKGRSDS